MAFRLKSGESLRKGIARLARKLMDEALEHLTGSADGTRDLSVHEARKCFKKIWALLRLVRPAIGKNAFREENTTFRDAGRPLTEVRDAKALVEALDALAKHFGNRVSRRPLGGVRKELLAHQREVRRRVLDEQGALAAVAAAVREARGRVDGWADVPDKWSSVGPGLKQVYRAARRAFAEAAADPEVEKLHEWRKQTKYLRYQLEMLSPLWPEVLEELAGQADRLGELLGQDHDLAVLRAMLTGDPERFGGTGTLELLLPLLDRRRAELQQEAESLGRRFFLDRPRDLARRLKGYWKAWRADGSRALLGEPSSP
jgi:CHAD domain-containing protein